MHLLQKTISYVMVGTILGSSSVSFALTNKESTLSTIDTLNTSITSSITLREKTLSDNAANLGNNYDTTIKSLGFQSDEVEALTSIKSLGVPSFRTDIAQSYQSLKLSMFQDIKTTQSSLASLRDEISLGYTDLSVAQKQSYDAKIADIQTKYTSFLSGSTSSIDSFTKTFSGRIATDSVLVKKMMTENSSYVSFIQNIRAGYNRIDSRTSILLLNKETFDKLTLTKVQGGFLIFATNKKTFTDAIRKDLTSGLEKAMAQERIKKQETELRAYIEDIMSKWNEYLTKNFSQDEELIKATKDTENTLALEKTLRSKIYDTNGNILPLDISQSGSLISEITKLEASMISANLTLSSLNSTYSTGNILSSLNDRLIASYKTELIGYRAAFTKLLQEKLSNSLLEEKNHAQVLALLDQEEQILKQNLSTVTSADYTQELVGKFNTKITALAKADGQSDTIKKAQMLSYRYLRSVTQKKIDDVTFTAYYGNRSSLDASLNNLFLSLENKSGKDALLIKFPIISEKINALLVNSKLSAKKRYSLLVVQSNILKYLEDASK